MAAYCADCVKLNLNDQNSHGEFWCGERRAYYPGSYPICSYFVDRDESRCLTTTELRECWYYKELFDEKI